MFQKSDGSSSSTDGTRIHGITIWDCTQPYPMSLWERDLGLLVILFTSSQSFSLSYWYNGVSTRPSFSAAQRAQKCVRRDRTVILPSRANGSRIYSELCQHRNGRNLPESEVSISQFISSRTLAEPLRDAFQRTALHA